MGETLLARVVLCGAQQCDLVAYSLRNVLILACIQIQMDDDLAEDIASIRKRYAVRDPPSLCY